MERISLNTGVKEFEIADHTGKVLGVLRLNTTDQNVYARFVDMYNNLPEIQKKYNKADEDLLDSEEATLAEFKAYRDVDAEIKAQLSTVFGEGNDFNQLLDGMNIMAMTDTGATVLENLLEALLPLIETDAKKRAELMEKRKEKAVAQANLNREQRRKLAKNG